MTPKRPLLRLALAAGLLAPITQAAPAPAAAAPEFSQMQWIDLRGSAADAAPYRRLWADRLAQAQRAWDVGTSAAPRGGQASVPAYTLTHLFPGGTLVSVLFDLYDCELPGNGPGADLYARCPARVLSRGASGVTTTRTLPRVCMLYVPQPSAPDSGPDPRTNHTLARVYGNRLQWRVVQAGQPVPGCEFEVDLT